MKINSIHVSLRVEKQLNQKLTMMKNQHERGLVTADGKLTLYDVTGVNKYQLKPFISATVIDALAIAWPSVDSPSLCPVILLTEMEPWIFRFKAEGTVDFSQLTFDPGQNELIVGAR